MKNILIILTLLSFNLAQAETDKMISKSALKKLSVKHESWLNTNLNKLISETSNETELTVKLKKIDTYKGELASYFDKNEEEMITDLRIEFRSVRDLYLASFPESKHFDVKQCESYWNTFIRDIGGDIDYMSKSAKKISIILEQLCNDWMKKDEQ